jgi:drug/metabolite transporter (DMT)-like permease
MRDGASLSKRVLLGHGALARLKLVGGALLFSTGAVAIKASALDGWQVAGLRALVAAVFLSACLAAARRGVSWRTLLCAVPYSATLVLYTLANKATTAANAIFLQDTAPLYVLLLGPVLLKERIRRDDLLLLVMLAVGLGLILAASGDPLATAPRPALGNALAAAAAVSWAFTLLGLRWIAVRSAVSGEEPAAVALAGCLLTAVACAPWAWPLDSVSVRDGLIVLYLGVFQIGLAYVLITEAMRRVPALEASLLLLVEPVFVPLWAWLLLGERAAAGALVGGAVIIAATAVHTLRAGAVR